VTYAIIGTGNVGTALARLFSRAGIEVSIANTRGPETIQPLIKKLGNIVKAKTLEDALEADIVFLPIPFVAVDKPASWHAIHRRMGAGVSCSWPATTTRRARP
jgi:8-hydroxy-5-deazaflavin:NADPH oxidoreductase